MRSKLTKDEKRALRFIERYSARRGFPPTYPEIAVGLGRSSKSSVYYLMQSLINKGYLEHKRGAKRGIRIIEHHPYDGRITTDHERVLNEKIAANIDRNYLTIAYFDAAGEFIFAELTNRRI